MCVADTGAVLPPGEFGSVDHPCRALRGLRAGLRSYGTNYFAV